VTSELGETQQTSQSELPKCPWLQPSVTGRASVTSELGDLPQTSPSLLPCPAAAGGPQATSSEMLGDLPQHSPSELSEMPQTSQSELLPKCPWLQPSVTGRALVTSELGEMPQASQSELPKCPWLHPYVTDRATEAATSSPRELPGARLQPRATTTPHPPSEPPNGQSRTESVAPP
jgi:protoheme ferro-lyase